MVFVDASNGNAVLGTAPVDPATGNASVQASSLGQGTHTIQANYNPPANTYTTNFAQVAQGVNAASTTVAVSSSLNPSVFGQPVTFTVIAATAQPSTATPTGTVTVSIDGSPVATIALQAGQSTFTTSAVATGSHTITASYTPDTADFTGSSTGTPVLQQVVTPAPTLASVSASANPTPFVHPVTLTATGERPPTAPRAASSSSWTARRRPGRCHSTAPAASFSTTH